MAETNEGKLQTLLEKFGGWAALALLSCILFIYQNDKADIQARTASNERAIGRLQDGKASKAELKELKEVFLREQQTTRQDFKDSINTLKNDIIQRIDLVMPRKQ